MDQLFDEQLHLLGVELDRIRAVRVRNLRDGDTDDLASECGA